MKSMAALLAAVLALSAGGCDEEDGAEPGASREATLVLDFTPNAVHAGLYAGVADGDYSERGVELEIREPGASTDAPKLLEAGRADFAILDINDLALARARGLDLVAVAPIVRVPLAAVISVDPAIRRPADLEGVEVGVTGLPSDDAVLDAVVTGDDADAAAVDRRTIGFESVAALSSGRVPAATAFWNAEGVQLRELGVRTREFRVADYAEGAYPELLMVTTRDTVRDSRELVDSVVAATSDAYGRVARGEAGVESLVEKAGVEEAGAQGQLDALLKSRAFTEEFDRFRGLDSWAKFAQFGGIVTGPEVVDVLRNGFRNP